MSKSKRRLLPRYSLRTFFAATFVGGAAVAWLANSYAEYMAEQQIIVDLTNRSQSLAEVINGETRQRRMMLMWDPGHTKVVVDYRGPAMLKPLAVRLPIPIFNRVREIRYFVRNAAAVNLRPTDVSKLTKLEEISFFTKTPNQIADGDVAKIEKKVPACRLSSSNRTEDKSSLHLNMIPGPALMCSAP